VDRLEDELEGQAEVVRLDVMSDLGMSLARRYGVRGLPTLIVYDGQGQVVYAHAGIPDAAEVVAIVQRLP